MRKSLLGIIDATMSPGELGELAAHRSPAAIPFAGRYRLIDFILSNMVNSGIESVGIFPASPFRSLMDHLGSGKDWDLNRKRDGLFFFTSENETQLARFADNMDYFRRSKQKYVVLSNCTTVANMDFAPMIDYLTTQKSDILEVTHGKKSAHIYLLSLELLLELIENKQESGYNSVQDAFEDTSSSLSKCQFEFEGFLKRIRSIDDYYQTSMELLQKETWSELFNEFQPIYTKVKDEPPTNYIEGSQVTNAMIANGCIIEGTINHSIVFRAVKVGENTSIKNSIIMQKSKIGRNCVIEHAILDKDVVVEDGTTLRGTPEKPLVIKKGSVESAVASS